jgi:hypothetical protein
MPKKRTLLLIPLLALLLSGCITLRLETKINKDDSGEKAFIFALDKSVMSMMESMAEESGAEMDDIWAEARESASDIEGAKVEDYETDDVQGIKIIVPFDDLKELEALSNNQAFEGTDSVSISQEGDARVLEATVQIGDITSGLGEAGAGELGDFDPADLDIEYVYVIDVQGDVLEYSPQDIAEIEESKVTWDLGRASGDTVTLRIKWEPGGGLNIMTLLLIALAGGAVVLVIVGVIVTMRGKRPPEALAPEAAPSTDPITPAAQPPAEDEWKDIPDQEMPNSD